MTNLQTLQRVRSWRLGFATAVFSLCFYTSTQLPAQPVIGPDVIVSELGPITKWGTLLGITAYSISTTSCNLGDAEASWLEFSDQHPVIAQNMYRVANGRIEQIGMSWVKHGFCALFEPTCGTCQPSTAPPCEALGIGCADTYGSSLNGAQGGLGPRSEINPYTGEFPYPFSFIGLTGPVLYKRINVSQADLNPTLFPGALYYYEAQYVHPEEFAWDTQHNNISHRRFNVGTLQTDGYVLNPSGVVIEQEPALNAWRTADPGVDIQDLAVPDDGMLMLGARATELGGGLWHYEYALANRNSHRAARTFAITLGAGAVVTNLYFHDIHHHSGEPYSTTDWTAEVTPSRVTWRTETFAQNPNANAIYWGTLYNFAFDCNVAPQTSQLLVGLFRPGVVQEVATTAVGPGQSCSTPDFVRGNMNGDAGLDISDAVYMLAYLFTSGAAPLPTLAAGDVNGDSSYDISDAVYLLAFLFSGGAQPPFPYPAPGCI